jgi:hypothetical protein
MPLEYVNSKSTRVETTGYREDGLGTVQLLDSVGMPIEDSSAMEQTFSARLAGIVLPDCDGKEIRLGTLWEANPAVVVFLRHYG